MLKLTYKLIIQKFKRGVYNVKNQENFKCVFGVANIDWWHIHNTD